MSMEAVYLQPAVILQYRKYRETSLLLDFFTRDHGIISMIAKGVRKEKSKMAGLLQPFSLLSISFLGKSELKTLTQAEYLQSYPLTQLAMYCGFYVNELLQKVLHKSDPHPRLFSRYLTCLTELSRPDLLEESLRYFELDLLAETGYGAELGFDNQRKIQVQAHLRYNFSADAGMFEDPNGIVSGLTLQTLAARQSLAADTLCEAKQLLRKMLDLSLHGRTLNSREVLTNIIKYL